MMQIFYTKFVLLASFFNSVARYRKKKPHTALKRLQTGMAQISLNKPHAAKHGQQVIGNHRERRFGPICVRRRATHHLRSDVDFNQF